ncbi:hypothetical protein ACFW2D_05770 [Streptomyces sp. NPDC058914]|uniref:hypothetical protein n=1 Tax=Streptomyces sp. NPDC058914 TaxID=3346671 RepID=UPI0036970D6C
MTSTEPRELTDRSVLLSLQEITEEIGVDGPDRTPQDIGEAAALLSELLAAAGLASQAPGRLVGGDEALARGSARRVLERLAVDEDTAAATRAVLSDPPADEQLSVEAAAAGAVVLGAVVAWLQTKIDIRIRRRNGETEFEFRLTKASSEPGTLRRLGSVIAELLTGPPQQ